MLRVPSFLLSLLPVLILLLYAAPPARASEPWVSQLGEIAVQENGRVMPLDAYARRLATKLTGREHWSAGNGPEAYSGRQPVELLCDLLFGGQAMMQKQLIGIENRPFKKLVGLEEQRKFFTPAEIAMNKGINDLLMAEQNARKADPQSKATKDERRAGELYDAANRVASLVGGEQLALAPSSTSRTFLKAGMSGGDPGTEPVRTALIALGKAYTEKGDMAAAVAGLQAAINSVGQLTPHDARSVKLELLHDRHNPWLKTAMLYGLAMVLVGVSRLTLRKPLVVLAVIAALAGVGEHVLGVVLRVMILDRAPVSNTYEALLWMGLVAMALGLVAQMVNRGGYYLFASLGAAFLSVLFANLVPLEDRTNALPAVLRSNYWLIVHVLTVVASYGVMAVASVLGHVYLWREVLFARKGQSEQSPRRSHTLVVQTYRAIQVGLLLLTAGTILGGVWAADSWGRFWGWDPKETWALISIVVYFALLHARYIGWLKDYGLAASAVMGFVVIVWTFYGVNYVMASGLHSYGFGSGGEAWVGLWAAIEIVFLIACRLRKTSLTRAEGTPAAA